MKLIALKKTKLFFTLLWKKMAKWEKITIGVLLGLMFINLLGGMSFLDSIDRDVQPQKGGVIVEGMLGQPRFINPVFAKSETEKAITSLVFSGLVSYNQSREIVPGLAERWEVSEDKKIYKFYLKQGVKWHDGNEITAEDILYFVAVVQNPDYNDSLKPIWEGVVVEKIDDYTVVFHLPKPYPLFLENMTTGILPRHLWDPIAVKDFSASSLNINAVGAGPYKIDKVSRDKGGNLASISLLANDNFVGGEPYMSRFEIKLYDNKEALVRGFERGEFSSFGLYSSDDKIASGKKRGYENYKVNLPQYIVLLFNTKSESAVSEKVVRESFAYALDKSRINEVGTYGAGEVIHSPILPGYLGYDADAKKYPFDKSGATTILGQAGWNDQDGDSIKEKGDKKLSLKLVTSNEAQFARVATEISKSLSAIGAKIEIIEADAATLERDYISTRNYDMLLIGENIGTDPDPYSYWHSSQVGHPGVNLANFTNGEVDKLLEEARQTTDVGIRIKNYKKFQEIIADEVPAIFLYQPVYIYKTYNKVRGIDLSGITNTQDRFSDVHKWFVKFIKA